MSGDPIPILELKGQLEESVERLAAPAARQREWIDERDFPIAELILDFDLCWPLWQERLTAEGAIDGEDVAALDQLHTYALPLVDPKYEHLFEWDAVRDSPEWSRVRAHASNALAALRRPTRL